MRVVTDPHPHIVNDRQNVAAFLNQWASERHLVAHRDSGTAKWLDEFVLYPRYGQDRVKRCWQSYLRYFFLYIFLYHL